MRQTRAISEDERRPGLYRDYPADFFDLIIIDECHRGSANDEGRWRDILAYFASAVQLGMTATPRREENADSYAYFGEPLYTYSLRQGIADGFLAPYRVQRVITSADALGWRPSPEDIDRYGRAIPDGEYGTADFERRVALRARTEAIARHLSDYLRATDRFAKTIVFCVDQDHADAMRRAISNLNLDLVQRNANYVARITADEGDTGRGLLSLFKAEERAAAERPDVPYDAEAARGALPRKFYFDGGQVEILAQVVYELDLAGNRLRVVALSDYAGGQVRALVAWRSAG